MSELEALCDSLDLVSSDIARMSQQLHIAAQEFARTSASAANAARSAEGEAAVALARTAGALDAAARHCNLAAQCLNAAWREGRAFVARTIGGGDSGGGSPVGAVTGTGSADTPSRGVSLPPSSSSPTLEVIGSWLKDVNPGYSGDPFDPRSSNCGECALAVFHRLNGDTLQPAEVGTLSVPAMEAATGLTQVPMSPTEIAAELVARGPGAHTVVGIDRLDAPGHWFNAYYDGWRVVAIDGQSGSILDWPPEYGSEQCPVTNWDAGVW